MNHTVVALHGFTSGPALFATLGLENCGLHVHAPHLTGHGPDPDLSGEEFDDELERLIAQVDAIPAPRHLLGYSMGARVGLGLAIRYPAVFRSVTLVGVNPGLSTEPERIERQAWEDRWIGILEDDGLAVFEHQWSRLPVFATQTEMPPPLTSRQREARLSNTAVGLAHALQVLGLARMPDYWPHLPMIGCPTRVVAGERDEKFRIIARRAEELLPEGRFIEVAGAGHNVVLEQPARIREILLACIEEGNDNPVSVRFRDG